MTRTLLRIISLQLLLATCLSAQPTSTSDAQALPPSPASSDSLAPAVLLQELGRALLILHRGKIEAWASRERFLSAFQQASGQQAARQVEARSYMTCRLESALREHRPWDEGPPLAFEVDQAIRNFQQLHTEVQTAQKKDSTQSVVQLSPCSGSANQTHSMPVPLSQVMAANRLLTRVEPVFAAGDWKLAKPAIVLLAAIIDKRGQVNDLRILSGPALLYQPALDAVRQWTYRPYILNGAPIPFRTTIALEFLPPKP